MKNIYKPMMYQSEMIQSLIKNLKTITRRTKGLDIINKNPNEWFFNRQSNQIDLNANNIELGTYIFLNNSINTECLLIKCPWQVGDIIWVRETFTEWPEGEFQYYATTALGDELGKWKPSIHMPKKACRLFLKVKSVRVERLQKITERDSIAEGVSDRLKPDDLDRLKNLNWIIPSPFSYHQFGFLALWCKLYGIESWLNNPWVWVIEFEEIEKPYDFITP